MQVDNDIDAEANDVQAPPSGQMRAKLKLVAHYMALAFAPAVSIAALVLAVAALNRHPDQAQAGESAARLDHLSADLAEAKAQLETLQVALAREKSMREEERKEAGVRDSKVVEAVSALQNRMKISPSLQEQLRANASALDAATVAVPAATTVSAPAPTQPLKAAVNQAAGPASTQSAAGGKPSASSRKPAQSPPTAKKPAKRSPQVKALKEKIEHFNKKK